MLIATLLLARSNDNKAGRVFLGLAALIFLAGIAFAYATTGTLNLAEMALRLDTVAEGTRNALYAVLLVAFGIKAAVFPLSSWLPDSTISPSCR